MNREVMLRRIGQRREPWDIAVVGGGATGAGVAVDAATRGYSVVLLEQSDFGKGTSSRSTKLAHGGVRYLQRGNVSLVRQGLSERALLRRNAPHLVASLPLVIPGYDWWERPFYGAGLKAYDLLAGAGDFPASHVLSRDAALARLPTLQRHGLRGGVLYHDGQFDDARLLLHLLWTAADNDATVLNYAQVTGLSTGPAGKVDGVVARDLESGESLSVAARVVINAAGAFSDDVRRLASPSAGAMIAPSQGTHIVLAPRFLPGETALMVPRVGDGRVLFAIPWRGHVLVGTTDTPIAEASLEPRPLEEEIDFLLATAGRYLDPAPTRADVLSAFTGVRPLVGSKQTRVTAALSRDHSIHVDPSGLVTTTGGKWTTYRLMAEHTVDRVSALAGLPARQCVTRSLQLHGFDEKAENYGPLRAYGADARGVVALHSKDPSLAETLDPQLPYTAAEVVWSARNEMARTVEDVLARRGRALFLNARAAMAMAPRAASLMARELGRDASWERAQVDAFTEVARRYNGTILHP